MNGQPRQEKTWRGFFCEREPLSVLCYRVDRVEYWSLTEKGLSAVLNNYK